MESYYHHLKHINRYKPTTNAEKLRRLKLAINFVLHDNSKEDQELYIKGCRLLDLLRQWVHSLSKSIAIQRQEHSQKVVKELPSICSPQDFLDNPTVTKRVKKAMKSLKTTFRLPDVKMITGYAAALMLYGNCQRSGVIQNLTLYEYDEKDYTNDGMVVVSCLHHKTGPQGRARLVLTREKEAILDCYKRLVRAHIMPSKGCEELFFLTPNGNRYTQVYRKIREAAIINGFKDLLPPPPNKYRIAVSTEAASLLDDRDLRNVARHLSHSEQTSRQYYEFANNRDAVKAHNQIEDLTKKRKWSTK